MPLLPKETEVFPENLFALPLPECPWLVVHVRSRQEKVLARHLMRKEIPFYLPQIAKTKKRAGRTLRSFMPLFPGYVFMRGGAAARETAWHSNVVANILDVGDQRLLDDELSQLRRLQQSGASLTPHLEVMTGTPVRITEGVFAGYRGIVVRERDQTRLIVTVSHVHRAVAVELSRDAVVRARP